MRFSIRWYVASSRLAEPAELKTMLALLLLLLLPAPALPQHTGCVLDPATGTTCEACNNTDDPGSACHHATGCPGAWHACCWAQHCACTPKPCPPADPAPAPAPTPPIPRTPTKKHIDWYCGECDSRFISPGTRGDTYANLVDGIMPCCGGGCHPDGGPCWGLSINCTSGQIDVDRHNLSAYAPFLRSGRTVNVDLSGAAACCRSKTDCTILENKHALASQVLDIALLYNLSGFTMDWEFGQSFNWGGYNETMAFIAETLRPHGIGLGISINSNCEAGPGSSSDPSCNPAYRNTPWAAILTDMGTYEIGDQQPTWSRRGPGNSTCPPPYDSRATDPSVLQYCGYEGLTLNVLHSPLTTVHTQQWPQLSPAMWVGECFENGTTAKGWTRAKWKAHLAFLDSQNITRIGLWCHGGADSGVGFPCTGLGEPYGNVCAWFMEELVAWKARGPGGGLQHVGA